MKRIEEAKRLLLNLDDHESDPDLVKLFKPVDNFDDIQQGSVDEDKFEEPLNKLPKIINCKIVNQTLSLDEVLSLLEDCDNINEENVQILYHSIIEHNLGLKQCIDAVTKYEDQGVTQVVLPILKREKDVLQDPESLSLLNESSQKIVLDYLAQESQEWTLLSHLNQLNLEDVAVQIGFFKVLLNIGHNKDLKLGKYLLSIFKILPKNLDSTVLDMLKQIVAMHGSFVKKACENELKKCCIKMC